MAKASSANSVYSEIGSNINLQFIFLLHVPKTRSHNRFGSVVLDVNISFNP